MMALLHVLLLVAVSWNSVQVNAAGPCTTPDGDDGKCVPITECPSLSTILHLVKDIPENADYLLKSACRSGVDSVGVCCAIETSIDSFAPEHSHGGATSGGYQLLEPPYCGESLNNGSMTRIMGGKPAKPGQFPWMATLGYGDSYTNYFALSWRCGGALITSKHVLTAAHCIVGFEKELKIARFGTNNAYDHGEAVDRRIVEIYVHENYDQITKNNDIAILKLGADINDERVRKICLPLEKAMRENTYVRYTPFIAGWGLTDFSNKDSDSPDMLMTQVPVTRNEVCKKAYEGRTWNKIRPKIDDTVMCAGYVAGGRDSCTGDSGGPLMLPRLIDDVSRHFAVGVVSYGFKCGEPGYPNVYTRVGKYIEWIQSKLNL